MDEHDLIARYLAPLARHPGAWGLADDSASYAPHSESSLVLTLDSLVESVHFLPDDPLDSVARKLVRVNVSDAIAKGARPRACLLAMQWPHARPETDFAQFASGLAGELGHWDIDLLGGDTVATPGPLTLSLTLLAEADEHGPVRRSGGQTGDVLFVTQAAPIGGSGIGLALWQGKPLPAGLSISRAGAERAKALYRCPEPPPAEFANVVARFARASMDVSDGLLVDAQRLARASGLCAQIDLTGLLLPPDMTLCGPVDERNAALCWLAAAGDDYQTLFSVAADTTEAVKAAAAEIGCPLARIGALIEPSAARAERTGLVVLGHAEVGQADGKGDISTWTTRRLAPDRLGFQHF